MAKKIQTNLDGVAACSHLGILSVVEENEGGEKGGVKKKEGKKGKEPFVRKATKMGKQRV